jgi:muramoyltetrapeptide carboxypeptidase
MSGVKAAFRKISPGVRVSVAAPSSPLTNTKVFKAGVKLLSGRYRVAIPKGVYARKGFLAGRDETRLRILVQALRDDRTRAIFTARGGYGATRLLSSVDWEDWYRDRIPLVGFSDITALELAALALAGVATVHGPSITSLARQPRTYLDHLFRLLEDPDYDFAPPPRRLKSLNQGRVQGPLVGGNLTMIDQLVGTPFLPELAGCVLFIEDVKEAPYRIDRMLTHLGNAGVLDRIVGVVVGDFAGCRPRADGVTVEDVIRDHVRRQRIPAARGMPSGHAKRNWAFIQGARVDLRCGYRGEKASLTAAKD